MVEKQIEIASQSVVCSVTFVEESQVVAGYENGDIRRWNIEDGQQLRQTVRVYGAVNSIAVSQDGRWIVSGDYGKQATVWNALTNEKVRHTEFGDHVRAVDFSSDCTKVVATSWSDTDSVRLSSTSSGRPLLPPLSHRGVDGVKFSPDSSRFATASCAYGVRVYRTHDGKVLFDSGSRGSIESLRVVTPLVWSSDGQQLFVASKGKITSFNISDSSSSDWPIHKNQSSVSIASNGIFIACSAGSSVSLWDCMSHMRLGSIITHTADIECIALSPSGGYLACGIGKNIIIHNLRDVLPMEYFDSGLPLVQLSGRILKSWTQGIPTNTEALLSEEIKSTSSPSHHLLACRAILRSRMKNVALAMEDSKESLRVRPSSIGYIAMAVTLLGQGDREGALRTFNLAFHDCEPDYNRLLLLLKSIFVFASGNQEDAIKCVRVKNLAPKNKQCPPLMTVSLIFGWSFDQPDIIVKRRLCETLYHEGRTVEAVEIIRNMMKTSEEDTQGGKTNADWIADFIQRCLMKRERVGGGAFGSAKHEDTAT